MFRASAARFQLDNTSVLRWADMKQRHSALAEGTAALVYRCVASAQFRLLLHDDTKPSKSITRGEDSFVAPPAQTRAGNDPVKLS